MANPDRYRLMLGVDFGTSSTKIAYFLHDEENQSNTPPQVVKLSGGEAAIPSCFAYFKNEFVFGPDLLRRVALPAHDDENVPAEYFIEYAKLGLYEQYWKEDGRPVGALKRQLATAGKTLDEAIIDYCEAVFNLGLKLMSDSDMGGSFRLPALKRMKKNARVSMPQIWSPSARGRMLRAVHKAGIDVVVAASESQCALAHYLEKTSQRNIPIIPKTGDYIVVADLGCGTADIVLYQLGKDMNEVNAISQANGALCGSYWVNEAVWQDLCGREWHDGAIFTGIDGPLSIHAFHWHLRQSIEETKTRRGGLRMSNYVDVQDDDGDHLYGDNVTKEDFKAAHDGPIEATIAAIDSLVAGKPAPKLILLAGGFRKSTFVQEAIKSRYHREGETAVILSDDPESTMVAEGAVSQRYDQIKTQMLPFVYSYALVRDEPAESKHHRDCFRIQNGKLRAVPKKVRLSPYGKSRDERLVIDRLSIILDRQDVLSPRPVSKTHRLRYATSTENPEITATFVYLDSRVRKFKDHESALQKDHDASLPWGTNALREGVHEWVTMTEKLDQGRLEAANCEKFPDANGVMMYHFEADVTIRYQTEANMTFSWRIIAGDDVWEITSEMWNGSYSEFSAEHGD